MGLRVHTVVSTALGLSRHHPGGREDDPGEGGKGGLTIFSTTSAPAPPLAAAPLEASPAISAPFFSAAVIVASLRRLPVSSDDAAGGDLIPWGRMTGAQVIFKIHYSHIEL